MFKKIVKSVLGSLSNVVSTRKLWFRFQQATLKLHWRLMDMGQANWIIRRPEWIRDYPINEMFPLEPSNEKKGSLEIDARLQLFYQSGISKDDELVGNLTMWSTYRDILYAPLFQAFKTNESNQFLGNVFRTSTVNGYSYGSTFDKMPHRWVLVPVHIELGIIQLAEYLGVVRSECADQGEKAFWRKLKSPEQIITEIEQRLGFEINHPRLGNPRGINFGGRFLTRETGSQIYTALRIAEAVEINRLGKLRILEIGGGYGGLSYWLHKVMGDQIDQHDLVDLPESCMMQGFFLGEHHDITLPHEKPSADKINIRLHSELEKIDHQPNLVINQDSMPEMPLAETERYIRWISENCTGLFVSFNQEAYAKNGHSEDLQSSVPDIVIKYPNLKRLSRNFSWDRRGYVEEVYKIHK